MPLTLVKEDGTGKVDANSYASAADGNAYHDGHLYVHAWEAAPAWSQETALVMATRLIDAQYQFNGFKANEAQALQWPRMDCPDLDGSGAYWPLTWWSGVAGGAFLPSDRVPKSVVDATCEMARELLIADRTAAPVGEGLKYQNVGTTQTGYDKSDRRPVMTAVAQAMLAKYGSLLKSGSGAVRLVRG